MHPVRCLHWDGDSWHLELASGENSILAQNSPLVFEAVARRCWVAVEKVRVVLQDSVIHLARRLEAHSRLVLAAQRSKCLLLGRVHSSILAAEDSFAHLPLPRLVLAAQRLIYREVALVYFSVPAVQSSGLLA